MTAALLSVAECARLLGYSSSRIRQHLAARVFGHLRLGSRMLLLSSDIAALAGGSAADGRVVLRNLWPDSQVITAREVASELNLSIRSIERRVEHGELRALRRRPTIVLDRRVVVRWLLARYTPNRFSRNAARKAAQ